MKDDLHDILDAVCEGLASGSKPRQVLATTNPNGRFRTDFALARAGVAAALFRSRPDTEGKIHDALVELSGGCDLATLPWADLKPIAQSTLSDLRFGVRLAQDFYRATFPTKTLVQRTFRISKLIELGDSAAVRGLLAEFPETDSFEFSLLWFRVLDREGDVIAAETIAARLHHHHPAEAAAAGVPLTFLYRTVGLADVARPTDEALDANIAASYLGTMHSHEDQSDVPPFIRSVADLISTSSRLAMAVIPYLQNQPWLSAERERMSEAARELALRTRLSVARQTGQLDLDAFCDLLGQADPNDPVEALPLVEHAIAIAPPPPRLEADVDPLGALLKIDYDLLTNRNQTIERALQTGLKPRLHRPDDPMTARVRMAAHQDPFEVMRGVKVHPNARRFLSQAHAAKEGAVLVGTHNVVLNAASYVSAVAAAEAGLDVTNLVGVVDDTTREVHAKWAEHAATPLPPHEAARKRGRMTYLHTRKEDASTISAKILSALGEGGFLSVSNDGLRSGARKAIVPWLLRPYFQTPYIVQLALSRSAAVGVQVWWVDDDGFNLDIVGVPAPPEEYPNRLRAVWMNQRVARATRGLFLQENLSFRPDVLRLFGGVPSEPDTANRRETLAEWLTNCDAAASVIGWAVVPQSADMAAAPALMTEAETVTRGEVRQMMLRAAAMVLHFQDGLPSGEDPACVSGTGAVAPRQHRIMVILLKGSALLAMTMGAIAGGSLLCVCQDDLTPDIINARFAAFSPDLIIATAGAWNAALEAHPSLWDAPVLLCGDGGDLAALEDLLESFDAATHLPRFDADRPALVVFTSGSDGSPKGTVLRAGISAFGTGMDALANLGSDDRVAYLTRWDAVGLVDQLACLRGGAALCVPDEARVVVPQHMGEWVAATKVTVMSAPSSLWALYLRSIYWGETPPKALRQAHFWGERITRALTKRAELALPHVALFCEFGTTESTYLAFGPLSTAWFDDAAGSPAGRPTTGLNFEVVDDGGRALSGRDVIGNLRIRSMNNMIGYLSEFDAGSGKETAVSGVAGWLPPLTLADNVKYRADGTFEVLGRSDSIIKIAGRRFSTTEIEIAAETVPGVERCIAMTAIRLDRTVIAVALEVVSSDKTMFDAEVEAAIGTMVGDLAKPRRILAVPEFPTLPSGKTDRRLLRNMLFEEPIAPLDGDEQAQGISVAPADRDGEGADRAHTRQMIRSWAVTSGLVSATAFDDNALMPPLSSIDALELMLLGEQLRSKTALEAIQSATHGQQRMTWAELIERFRTG